MPNRFSLFFSVVVVLFGSSSSYVDCGRIHIGPSFVSFFFSLSLFLSLCLSLSLSLLCLCFRLSRLSQQYRFCCIDTLLYIVLLASYPLGAFRTRAQIQVLSPNRSFSGPTEIPNSFEIPKNYFDFKFCVSSILISRNEVTEFQSFYFT